MVSLAAASYVSFHTIFQIDCKSVLTFARCNYFSNKFHLILKFIAQAVQSYNPFWPSDIWSEPDYPFIMIIATDSLMYTWDDLFIKDRVYTVNRK